MQFHFKSLQLFSLLQGLLNTMLILIITAFNLFEQVSNVKFECLNMALLLKIPMNTILTTCQEVRICKRFEEDITGIL